MSTDPAFDLTMPPGQNEVKLVVKDLMDRGGVGFTYRVVVKPVETAFQLTLNDDQVAIPRGGTALIPVNDRAQRIQRADRISMSSACRRKGGVTVLPGTVPAGQTRGVVGLKAVRPARFDTQEIQVVGKGEQRPDRRGVAGRSCSPSRRCRRPASAWPGRSPATARPFVSLTAAVTRPGPIVLNPAGSKARGAAGGHGRGAGPHRAGGHGDGEVQARRPRAADGPERDLGGNGRETCTVQR